MSDYLKYLNIIYDYYFNIRSSRSDSIFLNSVFPVYNTKEIKLLICKTTVYFFFGRIIGFRVYSGQGAKVQESKGPLVVIDGRGQHDKKK